jgi:hypothetical protein
MKTRRILAATTIVVLLSFAAIACSRAKSDAQIIGEVVTRINADSQVSNKQIAVASSNGVVTLTGSAQTDAERAAVANDAAQVEGVKTVVNNLLVASIPAAVPEQAEAQALEAQPVPAAKESPAHARKPAAYRERTVAAKESAKDSYVSPIVASSSYNTPVAYTPPPAAPMAASIPAPTTPAAPPAPTPVTIDPGTVLSVRMIDSINSERNHQGDMFHGTLDSPVMVGETVVIPEGADVTGRVVEVKDAGHFAGKPELALELTNLSVNGRKYTIRTDQYHEVGKSRGSSTAKTVGTGAAIGAIIGGIAGGGKGAAIGAAAGAGMGGGVQATRKQEQVNIASEALLTFQLQNSLTMTPSSESQQRRRLDDTSYTPPPQSQYDNRNYNDSSNNQNNTDRPVLKRRPSSPDQNN